MRNGAYRGRYRIDVPGLAERVKRSVVIGFCRDMTRSEARRRLMEIIAAEGINRAQYHLPSGITFAANVKKWEQTYVCRMKPSTQSTIHYHLDTYLLPRWGKWAVDFITAEKVNEWIGEAELSHLATETVRGIVKTLQRALGVQFGKGKINYRSAVAVEEDTRCFSDEEIAAILSTATGREKVLFTLAAETGMRAGELYGLQVEDVDCIHNAVHVRRSSWRGKLQSPKTANARRVIPVQPYVIKMLKEHLAGRQSGLVFLSRRGTSLQNTTVLHKHLHPLLAELGLPIGGMHAFRHFRVSFLVQNETPLECVKRWIGHGCDSMVRHYTHLAPRYQREVINRLPPVLAPQAAIGPNAVVQ
jgi:integrase